MITLDKATGVLTASNTDKDKQILAHVFQSVDTIVHCVGDDVMTLADNIAPTHDMRIALTAQVFNMIARDLRKTATALQESLIKRFKDEEEGK